MTTYLGFDVLEIEPNRKDENRKFSRSITRMDNGTGKISSADRSGIARLDFKFDWFLDGRADIATMKSFLTLRKGMAVPFWVPSWRHDLALNADAAALDTTLTLKDSGYLRHQYQQSARRQIAIITPTGTLIYRRITGCTNLGNGTEVVDLSSAVGASAPAATSMVCFLHLVRLESDVAEIMWHTQTIAEASMRFVEVPREIP